jgi:hypothetical protein
MKYPLLILLACLILAGSVSALPPAATVKPNFAINQADDSVCSDDPFVIGGWGVIWMKTWSNGGWSDCLSCTLRIDGQPPSKIGEITGYLSTYQSQFKFFQQPGRYSYKVTSTHGEETGTISVCENKISYIYVNKPLQITPAREKAIMTSTVTTIPTTTVTTVPAVTAPVTGVTAALTTAMMPGATNPAATIPLTGTAAAQPDTLGSLSVTTIPAGATILIDGVMRGASPATIPGLSAGSHTLLLKLDGYEDMSTPITISAGKTQEYSTAMIKNAAAGASPAVTENAPATPKKSPGFEFALALAAMGAILVLRKLS